VRIKKMRKIYLLTAVMAFIAIIFTSTVFAAENGLNDIYKAVGKARMIDPGLQGVSVKIAAEKAAVGAGGTGTGQLEALENDYVLQANNIALNVARIIIDLDFSKRKYEFLYARQTELELKEETTDNDFKMGKIDEKARDEVKKAVSKNGLDLNYYNEQVDSGKKSFQVLTGEQIPDDFDFDGAYLIIDAGKLQIQPPVSEDTDKLLKEAMEAYNNLAAMISDYIGSAEKLTEADMDYKTGKIQSSELEASKAARDDSRINVLEAKAQYSKLLLQLDCNLKGYISRDLKKLENPLMIDKMN
jgi:hypothetical protein